MTHQLCEEVEALTEGVTIKLKQSKKSTAIRLLITGKVNGIDVKAETLTFYVDAHMIVDMKLVQSILPSTKLLRTDGRGKSVPIAARMSVEKAVFKKVKHIRDHESCELCGSTKDVGVSHDQNVCAVCKDMRSGSWHSR